jgi:hypothetical protein
MRRAREEYLDQRLILGEEHRWRVPLEYIEYDNRARPHHGIAQRCPIPIERSRKDGTVKCRDFLDCVIHDDYRDAT